MDGWMSWLCEGGLPFCSPLLWEAYCMARRCGDDDGMKCKITWRLQARNGRRKEVSRKKGGGRVILCDWNLNGTKSLQCYCMVSVNYDLLPQLSDPLTE